MTSAPTGSPRTYARKVLEAAKGIFERQLSLPLEPGCGEFGCYVHDGRILAGLAWLCPAHRAETGGYPSEEAAGKVLRGAELFARRLMANRGWYDAGCLVEGACPPWYGNMYELCDEYLRQVGEGAGVRRLMEHLVLGARSGARHLLPGQ